MSGFFILDEPFEGDRVPTADDLRRATPLPGVTSWLEWSADPDPEPAPVSGWQIGDRVEVHEVAGGYIVLPAALDDEDTRAKAEIERQTRPTPDPLLASGGPVSPAADITAAMQRLDLHLTPWQQRVADAAFANGGRLPSLSYPKQSGRRSISRVVAEAMNGAPVPLSRDLLVTITADTSGAFAAFAAAADRATHSLRLYDEAWAWLTTDPKRRRRRQIERRRVEQAMRGFARRTARRQRRAASRAARGVTR